MGAVRKNTKLRAAFISLAFSGAGGVLVALTILNALLFGIVAAELVVLTGSILPAVAWHILYDFANWIALMEGETEFVATAVQSLIIVAYAAYLWRKLPDAREPVKEA